MTNARVKGADTPEADTLADIRARLRWLSDDVADGYDPSVQFRPALARLARDLAALAGGAIR